MSIAGSIYDGGGTKGVKFERIGDTAEGVILSIQERQLEEFPPGSGRPQTWPSGQPKITPIITIQTTLIEDEDDDGRRAVYFRGGAFTAFGEALREAYSSKPTDEQLIGATLKLRFDQSLPTNKGNDRKVFLCRITPGASAAGKAWDREPGDEQGSPPQQDQPPPMTDDDVPF